MGSNPINLFIRFLLEIAALSAFVVWGWRQGDGGLRFFLAIGIPILAAILWGTFAVPDDPSRSGKAPIATPGVLRLAIVLVIFASATWALKDVGFSRMSWTLGILVILHYIASYDRIGWLIKH